MLRSTETNSKINKLAELLSNPSDINEIHELLDTLLAIESLRMRALSLFSEAIKTRNDEIIDYFLAKISDYYNLIDSSPGTPVTDDHKNILLALISKTLGNMVIQLYSNQEKEEEFKQDQKIFTKLLCAPIVSSNPQECCRTAVYFANRFNFSLPKDSILEVYPDLPLNAEEREEREERDVRDVRDEAARYSVHSLFTSATIAETITSEMPEAEVEPAPITTCCVIS